MTTRACNRTDALGRPAGSGGTAWSSDDDSKLRRMREEKVPYATIAGLLNRTVGACYSQFYRNGTRDTRVKVCHSAPSELLAEARHRAGLQHQSFTAAILGDPLPGRSALDQKLLFVSPPCAGVAIPMKRGAAA